MQLAKQQGRLGMACYPADNTALLWLMRKLEPKYVPMQDCVGKLMPELRTTQVHHALRSRRGLIAYKTASSCRGVSLMSSYLFTSKCTDRYPSWYANGTCTRVHLECYAQPKYGVICMQSALGSSRFSSTYSKCVPCCSSQMTYL